MRIVGPPGTSKTVILNTFAKRNNDKYTSLNIPISSYLTFTKLKTSIESHYMHKRSDTMEPKD